MLKIILTQNLHELFYYIKPGKKPENLSSCRAINLLSMLSKVFGKSYLKRLKMIIDKPIKQKLKRQKILLSCLFDICQAFDTIWHTGLQIKRKKFLYYPHFQLLTSYLKNRHFLVKQRAEQNSPLHSFPTVRNADYLKISLHRFSTL